MRRAGFGSLPLASLLLLPGCSGVNCTLIGSVEGVVVEIPRQLWVAEGDVVITVCDDDGCESATRRLARLTKNQGGGRPQPRGQAATWKQLGREFEDGPVHVTVELLDETGAPVARREEDTELTRSWPNGKQCDGDGFVGGGVDLRPEDAVGPPT